jgi:hypothetical protein
VPYLLVVEDAHWADEATLDLLRHLARRVHTCRAAVLVTFRPEDVPADHPLRRVLGDAATGAGVRRVDLAPLSPADARAEEVHVHGNLGTAELADGDPETGRRLLTDSLDRARAADLQEHAPS